MQYLRRFLWFIATRLLVLVAVLGIAITAFYFAMNAANIRIIAKEGLARRAQVIMMNEGQSDLPLYFSNAVLSGDSELQAALNGQSDYRNYYSVTGFDHRIRLVSVWCWPWEDTARATVREEIPRIDGKMRALARETALSLGLPDGAPKWQTREYTMLLSKENGKWIVKNMTVREVTP